jgi:hypothetical protein
MCCKYFSGSELVRRYFPWRLRDLQSVELNAPFDRAMVLFHDIVQVWTRAASAATPQFPLLLQFRDHLRVGRIAVSIDYPRTGMTPRLQGFLEEALRCGRIPVCRKREIDCGACGIDRSI